MNRDRIATLPNWKHALAVDAVTRLDAFISGLRLLSLPCDRCALDARFAWHHLTIGGAS